MIMVTKIKCGCVISQGLEFVISISPKLLLLVEINKYELIKMKTFYFEKICLTRIIVIIQFRKAYL